MRLQWINTYSNDYIQFNLSNGIDRTDAKLLTEFKHFKPRNFTLLAHKNGILKAIVPPENSSSMKIEKGKVKCTEN